jgi:hypothetical protein
MDFNWMGMSFPTCDINSLSDVFSEKEVSKVIKSMPSDKAPCPDGFTSAFFKAYLQTIKEDYIIHQLFEPPLGKPSGSIPQT